MLVKRKLERVNRQKERYLQRVIALVLQVWVDIGRLPSLLLIETDSLLDHGFRITEKIIGRDHDRGVGRVPRHCKTLPAALGGVQA